MAQKIQNIMSQPLEALEYAKNRPSSFQNSFSSNQSNFFSLSGGSYQNVFTPMQPPVQTMQYQMPMMNQAPMMSQAPIVPIMNQMPIAPMMNQVPMLEAEMGNPMVEMTPVDNNAVLEEWEKAAFGADYFQLYKIPECEPPPIYR